jgi:hypothetical protein
VILLQDSPEATLESSNEAKPDSSPEIAQLHLVRRRQGSFCRQPKKVRYNWGRAIQLMRGHLTSHSYHLSYRKRSLILCKAYPTRSEANFKLVRTSA